MNKLKQAIMNNTLYDYIVNYGYQMNKDDLITIIKELSYCLYKHGIEESILLTDDYYINELLEEE